MALVLLEQLTFREYLLLRRDELEVALAAAKQRRRRLERQAAAVMVLEPDELDACIHLGVLADPDLRSEALEEIDRLTKALQGIDKLLLRDRVIEGG